MRCCDAGGVEKEKKKSVVLVLHEQTETMRTEMRRGARDSRAQSAAGSVPSLTPERP